MTALVPIQPGQWVLAYREGFGPYPGSGELREYLERLVERGCYRPTDQFSVHLAVRVMPKTYLIKDSSMRHWRDQVIAAAATAGEVEALRDKLFAIGTDADRAIEAEVERRVADFARMTRAEALVKIHSALPHIFGRSA